jgi:hypothetical protein
MTTRKIVGATTALLVMDFEHDFPLSARSEDLTPTEESSLDPDVLETIQIAGQRVFRQHNHVRDLANLERPKPVLVPGQLMSALRRHAQCLSPGEVTFPELALAVLVPHICMRAEPHDLNNVGN